VSYRWHHFLLFDICETLAFANLDGSFYHADEVFHYRFSVRLTLKRHDIFVMWLRTAMIDIEVTVPALSLKIFVGITPLTTTALLQMKAVVTFCCEI